MQYKSALGYNILVSLLIPSPNMHYVCGIITLKAEDLWFIPLAGLHATSDLHTHTLNIRTTKLSISVCCSIKISLY